MLFISVVINLGLLWLSSKLFMRLEDIIIGLINAQKKLQTDFGRELARLEGSYRALSNTINKLLEKDRKRDNK